MRKFGKLALSAAVAVALVGLVGPEAHAQEHKAKMGKQVTLENVQVIDLHCFTAGGMKGEMHKECNIACAKAGVPLGLLSQDGKVYVPISHSPMTGQSKFNAMLQPHAEGFVTVRGTLFERGGVQGIEIESVKPAKA